MNEFYIIRSKSADSIVSCTCELYVAFMRNATLCRQKCHIYRKLNNKQHMNLLFSGFFPFSCVTMLKIKSMVYGCDVSTAKRIVYLAANRKIANARLFLPFFFCDFEKQIFLMFTIIHGADAINMLWINISWWWIFFCRRWYLFAQNRCES